MTDSKTIVREISKMSKVWSSIWHKVRERKMFLKPESFVGDLIHVFSGSLSSKGQVMGR